MTDKENILRSRLSLLCFVCCFDQLPEKKNSYKEIHQGHALFNSSGINNDPSLKRFPHFNWVYDQSV